MVESEISIMDIAIWEMHGPGQEGMYQLALSLYGGGSVTMGSLYKTKTEAREALYSIKKKLAGICLEDGFGIMHAILSRLDKTRL